MIRDDLSEPGKAEEEDELEEASGNVCVRGVL